MRDPIKRINRPVRLANVAYCVEGVPQGTPLGVSRSNHCKVDSIQIDGLCLAATTVAFIHESFEGQRVDNAVVETLVITCLAYQGIAVQ